MSTFISLLLFWKVRKIFCGNNYSQTFKKVGLRFRSIYIEKRISLMRIDWHLWHHFRLLAICMLYIYVYNEDYNEWKCELSPFYHVHMCVLCVYRHIDAVYQAYFKSATAADTSRNALLSSFKGWQRDANETIHSSPCPSILSER